MEVAPPRRQTWYWYLIGLALLLALAALVFPQRKKKPGDDKPLSDENAYREAMQQLEGLKKELTSGQDVKLFYTTLIDIFRTYLQKRKNIQSYSKTTDDIAVKIKDLNLPAGEAASLLQTLQVSDLVKFARFQPTTAENDTALHTIKNTIVVIEKLP